MSRARRLALWVSAAAALATTGANGAELSTDAPIVLGANETVTLTLRLEAGSAEAQPDLRVNVGAVEAISAEAPGLYRITYRLPPERFPQVARFALVREQAGATHVDFLGVPLYGALLVPVRTDKGNRVVVQVGERLFGPLTVGETGTLRVPIVVPPGLNQVEVRVTGRTVEAARPVTLSVPTVQHLLAVATAGALPADGESATWLHVFHDGGRVLSPAEVEVVASAGTVAFERVEGQQLVYRYKSPLAFAAVVAQLTVSVRDDPLATATVPIELVAQPRPRAPDPPPLEARAEAPKTPTERRERLSLGARLGLVHNLVASVTPRFGGELWVQLPLPISGFGVGLSGSYGFTSVELAGPVATRATAHFGSLALEVAYAHRLGPWFDVRGAAGPTLTLVTSVVEAGNQSSFGAGFGGVARIGAGLRLGPGRLFLDVTFRLGIVSTPLMLLDPGGLGLELGYQLGLL